MLLPEDQTSDGPPNDAMVEALLRREGKYAEQDEEAGKVLYAEPMEQLEAIKWEWKDTHVEAYEAYMAKWTQLMRTMYESQKPPANKQAKIMRKAVKPKKLSKRIRAKSWDGLGPHKLSKEFQQWRVDARENPMLMRRLIRENANHWDRMGILPDPKGEADSSNETNGKNAAEAPTCKAASCPNKATARYRGGGYYQYCSDHKHLAQKLRRALTPTTPATTPGAEPAQMDASNTNNPQQKAATANTDATANKLNQPATATTPTTPINAAIFTEPGADKVDLGTCIMATCNKKPYIRRDGKITLACSQECYSEWEKQGKVWAPRPCQLCGGPHGVLRCPQLTEERKADMISKIQYQHVHSWWHYVNNIAKAKNYIDSVAPSQKALQPAGSTQASTHGDAQIGPLCRRVYFDLGGEYDLIDDQHYELLKNEIQAGNVVGAKLLTPQELGFSCKGVPVDLACASENGASSVSWIKKWIRITVRVMTDTGRHFTINRLHIGVVKRTTPLLILGKRTCALCGYKTIRQQDMDRHDDDYRDSKDRVRKAKKWAKTQTSSIWQEKEAEADKSKSGTGAKTKKAPLNLPVMHLAKDSDAKAQFLQIAACDIPLQEFDNSNKQWHKNEAEDNKDKQHRNKNKHSWSDKSKQKSKRQRWKNGQTRGKYQAAGNGTARATVPNLAAEGKSRRGDNADNSEADADQEDDDEEGPHAKNHCEIEDPAGWTRATGRSKKFKIYKNPGGELQTKNAGGVNNLSQALKGANYPDEISDKFEIDFIFADDDEECCQQYINVAASQEALQEMDDDGNDIHDPNLLISDGYLYAGKRGIKDMEACGFIVTDRLSDSYITTAALRRSGCHPEHVDKQNSGELHNDKVEKLKDEKDLYGWITGDEDPHSTLLQRHMVTMDQTKVTHPFRKSVIMNDQKFIVIASNKMCVIMGYNMVSDVDTALEKDENPMQTDNPDTLSYELQESLQQLQQTVMDNEEISEETKRQTSEMLEHKYYNRWKTKYDLQQPADFPPMEIRLKEGARPQKIKRQYRWTKEQRRFLRGLLRKLVDVGVISRVDSEWLCPVVLVIKPDLTWRLCVDPTALNKATIPMIWQTPKPRELIQEELHGMRWMSKFDFTAMFWQIPLQEESRKLFSFYAGDMGSFQFNRVAMGALNSSIYTQRMISQMFSNTKRKNGKPLLGNGLIANCDDILLYAGSEKEMLELLELFFHTISCHKLSLSPSKCQLFCKETIYCGLKISREGIKVDPERINGLLKMPQPDNIGDVWQFNASAGWIREELPLFSEASTTLTDLITGSLKGLKKRDMRAARKISLAKAGWKQEHQRAWDTIRKSLMKTICTSFRDRRKKACLVTDASSTGWAYVITQCDPDELHKPWQQQKHEILAVNSGKFRNSQRFWAMPCKEAYPIRRAVERHRYLLAGNTPFASINDHK